MMATLIASAALGAAAPSWTGTGSLKEARYAAKGAALADGRVLVVGGSNSARLATAEIFDPVTGSFALTGSMGVARQDTGAAGLPSGKVLVAGGFSTEPTNVAELFSPATGTFAATGSMSTVRQGPLAVTLLNGKVLVAGGNLGSGGGYAAVNSAEYYDPQTGSFSSAPSMSVPRTGAGAALLSDGRVLIVGGNANANFLSSAEIFDPTTGLYTPTGSMAVARTKALVAPLQDGRVLVAGGETNSTGPLSSAEIFNPATGSFTATAPLAAARGGAAGGPLADGRVLIAGGSNASAEIFSPGAALGSSGVAFGGLSLGSSTVANATVTNTGSESVAITASAITGAAASEFQITADGCAGRSLTAGQSCTVSVRFAPATLGPKTAGLLIAGDRTGAQTFSLTGTGSSVAAPPAGPGRSSSPPQTRLRKHPPKVVEAAGDNATVKFGFSSPAAGATFRCKIDKQKLKTCRSPKSYRLVPGKHVFRVAAVSGGVPDPSPAVFRFKVVPDGG